MMFYLFLACQSSDYAVRSQQQTAPAPLVSETDLSSTEAHLVVETFVDNPEDLRELITGEPDEVQVRIDLAMQRLHWGESLIRCQVQVAFERRAYPPPEEPSTPPESFNQPDGPGECAFTHRDPPEAQADSQQNWYVSGHLQGPDAIYLHGDQVYELVRTQAEDGLVRYELRDCDEESFPAAEILSLEIPPTTHEVIGDELAELPEVWMENIVAVGPDIQLLSPSANSAPPTDWLHHAYSGNDLELRWDQLQPIPELVNSIGERSQFQQSIQLYNNRIAEPDPWRGLEVLLCQAEPLDDRFTIDADWMSEFTVNQDIFDNSYHTGLTVNTVMESPSFEDPWGRTVFVRSTITEGGILDLVVGEGEDVLD